MYVKEFEKEVSNLKAEFTDLKSKIDTLASKYTSLENMYEKLRKKRASFKCQKCGEELESLGDLKEHKKKHKSCIPFFNCDECEKSFKDESKLQEHIKKHIKFPCDDCGKMFDFEITLEKHNEAVHGGDIHLFCHFFNNDKKCPYDSSEDGGDDKCIFDHEIADVCKFGSGCERKMCMYSHGRDNIEETENESIHEEDDAVDESSIEDLKPVIKRVQEAIETFDNLIKKSTLICKDCEFEAKNLNGLNMHIKAKHTNKS